MLWLGLSFDQLRFRKLSSGTFGTITISFLSYANSRFHSILLYFLLCFSYVLIFFFNLPHLFFYKYPQLFFLGFYANFSYLLCLLDFFFSSFIFNIVYTRLILMSPVHHASVYQISVTSVLSEGAKALQVHCGDRCYKNSKKIKKYKYQINTKQ